jgi:hypothetical protein
MTATERKSQLPPKTIIADVFALASRIVLLIVPAGLVAATLFFILPRNPDSYYHGFALKYTLLGTSRSPKIVLVGGSNLAFGIDSHMLSSTLGVNVVNSALHAGLGADFMLDSVEKYIHAGDTVVIALEYVMCLETKHSAGDATLYEFLFEEPEFVRYCRKQNFAEVCLGLARASGARLATCLSGEGFEKDEFYHANAFNEYGDVISHLDKPSPGVRSLEHGWGDEPISHALLKSIRTFIERVEDGGASVFILPPCCRAKDYFANDQGIESVYLELKRAFPRQTLSNPQEFVLEGAEYFFDSGYHLSRQGREIRTAKIVECLRYAGMKDGGGLRQ